VSATARASLSLYNTFEEVDRLVAAIGRVRKLLG
jgi:selenocysteine lyase/cysteine desulfurase